MENGVIVLRVFLYIIMLLFPISVVGLFIYVLCLKIRFYNDMHRYVNHKIGEPNKEKQENIE